MQRRHWMLWATATIAAWSTGSPARGVPVRLAAAWRRGDGYQAGVLRADGERLRMEAVIDLPSRPHAVRVDAAGHLLVVARRPGDWLLRWWPGDATAQWQWIEPDRSFNGHVLPSLDGRLVYTPETDLASGTSVVGVRDVRSFEKLAEWPTGGSDAHDLCHDDAGQLMVANGGVRLQQETGRLKLQLATMDSSVVQLDAATGRRLGQWRLADRRLSLRHMAWGPRDARGRRTLGIALQAEHADAAQRAAAPVLAVFDGEGLRACEAGVALSGYGGDVAATPVGFAVSCPRAGVVAHWHADGRWLAQQPLPRACALAAGADAGGMPHGLWAGGVEALAWRSPQADGRALALPGEPPIQLDNHWALLPARQVAVVHGNDIEKKETP